jgi:hypothetical protein
MSFSEALAAPPPTAAVLAGLPTADPALLRDIRVGGRYIVMDGMGPGEAVGTVRSVVNEGAELELVDATGVIQSVWFGPSGESRLGRWWLAREATHPVDELAGVVLPATPHIVPVPTRIVGTAFFPGGSGLWRPAPTRQLPAFPVGGVLIVGHDFGTVGQYVTALRAGREPVRRNATWRGLTVRLDRAGIPLTSCFFTNAYLGLRETESPTGAFPGRADKDYWAACLAVLARTIVLQQPRLIVTLGRYVPALLARLATAGLTGWRGVQTFAEIDQAGPIQRDVRLGDVAATVVALTHPSLGSANAHRRRYDGDVRPGETVDDVLLRGASD